MVLPIWSKSGEIWLALACDVVRRVVADTGPINYLVIIGHIHVLSTMFGRVSIPEVVRAELGHSRSPDVVQRWIASHPPWLVVQPDPRSPIVQLPFLDDGEREALLLARSLNADLVLMDDRAGVAVAVSLGLAVIGTVGLLDLAARRGLIDLPEAFGRLRATSFRCRAAIYDEVLLRFHQDGAE
jgi:predicted nucleic acid-binding protein